MAPRAHDAESSNNSTAESNKTSETEKVTPNY